MILILRYFRIISLISYLRNQPQRFLVLHRNFKNIPRQPFTGLSVLDCFCGAGIGAAGADLAGLHTVCAFDNNAHAVRNYNNNIHPVAEVVDANENPMESLPRADIVTGGFPCKPWSVAGKREAQHCDKYGDLAQWMVDGITCTEPKAFFIENVKGLTLKTNKSYFEHLLHSLQEKYEVSWRVIDCSRYGVPQKRDRVFIIGIHRDYGHRYVFPRYTHGLLGEPLVTVQEALLGLPEHPDGVNNHEYHAAYTLRNDEKPYAHKVPEGGNWRDLSAVDRRAFLGVAYYGGGGRSGFLYRVPMDKPSRTILSTPMGKNTAQIILRNGVLRRYTVRESLRIQSAPDWVGFDEGTPISLQYERVSGIPTKVSYMLLSRLSEYLV